MDVHADAGASAVGLGISSRRFQYIGHCRESLVEHRAPRYVVVYFTHRYRDAYKIVRLIKYGVISKNIK